LQLFALFFTSFAFINIQNKQKHRWCYDNYMTDKQPRKRKPRTPRPANEPQAYLKKEDRAAGHLEIAKELGVTKARVGQIEKNLLLFLKSNKALQAAWFNNKNI